MRNYNKILGIKNLKDNLYRTLLIIGILNIFSISFLIYSLKAHDKFAHVINISGRQRMLSQLISKHLLELSQIKEKEEKSIVINNVLTNLKLFQESNETLIQFKVNDDIKNAYFHPPHNLEKEINEFISDIKKWIAEKNYSTNSNLFKKFYKKDNVRILFSLDYVVFLYQKASERNLKILMITQSIVFGILLLSLIFIAFIIYRPLVDVLEKSFTELSNTKAKLIESRDLAEKHSKAKSIFLSNMSHEIRTPMNSIIGISDVLWDTELSNDQRQYVKLFRNAGKTLIALINDVLDLAKIESEELVLKENSFDFLEAVDTLIKIFETLASNKKLNLSLEISKDVPQFIYSSEQQLIQILTNLLGNALKFTETGGVVLKIRILNISKSIATIEFIVEDTGIGILESEQEKIFEVFSQTDMTLTKKYEGTGLGLSISKMLIEKMGGELELESKLNEGSKFKFSLPLTLSKINRPTFQSRDIDKRLEGIEGSPIIDGKELSILLADDSYENRMILKLFLKDTKHQIHEVTDGIETIKIFKEKKFDLIFLDMYMPNVDGIKAVQEMRKYESSLEEKIHTPIYALTANALTEMSQSCLDAGCDFHLIKPIKKETIIKIINYHARSI